MTIQIRISEQISSQSTENLKFLESSLIRRIDDLSTKHRIACGAEQNGPLCLLWEFQYELFRELFMEVVSELLRRESGTRIESCYVAKYISKADDSPSSRVPFGAVQGAGQ